MVTDGELSGGARNVQEPIAAGSGSVTEEVRTISQTTLITHLRPIFPLPSLFRYPQLATPLHPPSRCYLAPSASQQPTLYTSALNSSWYYVSIHLREATTCAAWLARFTRWSTEPSVTQEVEASKLFWKPLLRLNFRGTTVCLGVSQRNNMQLSF